MVSPWSQKKVFCLVTAFNLFVLFMMCICGFCVFVWSHLCFVRQPFYTCCTINFLSQVVADWSMVGLKSCLSSFEDGCFLFVLVQKNNVTSLQIPIPSLSLSSQKVLDAPVSHLSTFWETTFVFGLMLALSLFKSLEVFFLSSTFHFPLNLKCVSRPNTRGK